MAETYDEYCPFAIDSILHIYDLNSCSKTPNQTNGHQLDRNSAKYSDWKSLMVYCSINRCRVSFLHIIKDKSWKTYMAINCGYTMFYNLLSYPV